MSQPYRAPTQPRLLLSSSFAAVLTLLAACGGGGGGSSASSQSLASNQPTAGAVAASAVEAASAPESSASDAAKVAAAASAAETQAAASTSASKSSTANSASGTTSTTSGSDSGGGERVLALITNPASGGSQPSSSAVVQGSTESIDESAASLAKSTALATTTTPSAVTLTPVLSWNASTGYQPVNVSTSAATTATASATSAPLVTTSLSAVSMIRQVALFNMAPAVPAGDTYQKTKMYDILAQTALRGCGQQSWRDYIANIGNMTVANPADGPIEMFSLPPLVRYLHQFGSCLTSSEKASLLASIANKKQWLFGHGTTNHAIMRASSWYLLAQYFPNAKWTDWDGKQLTSADLMAQLKPLLAARTWRFYQSSQTEMLSPTYAMVDFFPLLNLIDFATDASVKAQADKEATLEVSVLKAHSFRGVLVAPLTRKNYDQHNANDTPANYAPSVTQHVLWYYYGAPNLSGYEFQNSKEPHFFSMLSLSNWHPPAILNDVDPAVYGKYSIKHNTPTFTTWDQPTSTEIYGDSFISDDFAIGTGNLFFSPDAYSGHIQTFGILLKSSKPNNQIECYQPYWNSNAGEDAWGQDRSSPFQQMYRYDESSVIMLFDTPKADPWVYPGNTYFANRDKNKDQLLQLAQCRIPKNVDETVRETNWVFVREGNTFVAIGTLKGKNEYNVAPTAVLDKFTILKVREAKTALYFRVDKARSDLTFAQFQAAVKKSLPTYDANTSTATFVDKSGVNTSVKLSVVKSGSRWSAVPVVTANGVVRSPETGAAIDSPVLTLKNGQLDIKSKVESQKVLVSR